ncbi:MAG: hypothetical protein LBV00_03470 [Propionibacteriaceae bacterium]|jgi:antitoxin (DNA-binding transcriptional repressor) of toxin-antitoxin stability system|nr:hypothetical protein [Propionibacteriaceae bacterium]
MTVTLTHPTTLTATEASRTFASVLERARNGETFTVEKGGVPMAQITPPSQKPNGAALLRFLATWDPDPEGFTDDVLAKMEALDGPQPRDEERMTWVADYA